MTAGNSKDFNQEACTPKNPSSGDFRYSFEDWYLMRDGIALNCQRKRKFICKEEHKDEADKKILGLECWI